MANEFVARNGIISLDSSQITGSLRVTQGVTASLFGTSSWSSNAISSSFATSASNASTASFVLQAVSSSFATSASLAQTASFVLQAVSASFATKSTSASFVSNATTASFATTASSVNTLVQPVIISGSFNLTGSFNSVTAVSYTRAASGFTKSFAIINNSNIAATDVGTFPIWRCNVPCTASMVLGYTDFGSSVLVNALKNSSALLASNLSISTNTWVSSSTLQNQNFNLGDILSFQLVSFSSTPKQIAIQTTFTY